MVAQPETFKHISIMTHYVTTTMNTTWTGLISEMREDYNYLNLFYGTEEECLAELEARQTLE